MSSYLTRLKLDRLDFKIISALLKRGRITKVELSEQVGLSASPCWERMKRLEKEGIIRGYHADIDFSKLMNISCFRVEVTLHNYSMNVARQFEELVRRLPEVIECEAVLGRVDYILKVAAPSIEQYQELIERILDQEKISFDYVTFPVAKPVKSLHDMSLQALVDMAGEEQVPA
ncbi:Lrp/AsnC family transcriptional regulator [Emcibacter sp.]|uniref:Lrp/AsnC family transcriptional regulator n=1 Tax=Emcibacter sp. TaxID=1979954 RepID=UPI002AA7852E|nr:Lrp/AsnC family transcriptional regulator [Emcibacter sp.]